MGEHHRKKKKESSGDDGSKLDLGAFVLKQLAAVVVREALRELWPFDWPSWPFDWPSLH